MCIRWRWQILGSDVTKTVSTFIEDYLTLDISPVDGRVRVMLRLLGLPKDEDTMVKLREVTAVNPKELNRMLLSYYADAECAKMRKEAECS